MVMLPRGMPFSNLGEHCGDSIRGQGFQSYFCIWYPRDIFSPLCVVLCRHVHETQVPLCTITRTDDSWVGGNMCNCKRNFLQLPYHILQGKTSFSHLLPSRATKGMRRCWVPSPSAQRWYLLGRLPQQPGLYPLSVVGQIFATGMHGMSLWFARSLSCRAAHLRYWNVLFLLLLTFQNLFFWSGQQDTWKTSLLRFVNKMGPHPSPTPQTA